MIYMQFYIHLKCNLLNIYQKKCVSNKSCKGMWNIYNATSIHRFHGNLWLETGGTLEIERCIQEHDTTGNNISRCLFVLTLIHFSSKSYSFIDNWAEGVFILCYLKFKKWKSRGIVNNRANAPEVLRYAYIS